MKFLRVFLYVLSGLLVLRGAAVFDTGASAQSSYPTASAICLVGGAMLLLGMYAIERWSRSQGADSPATG